MRRAERARLRDRPWERAAMTTWGSETGEKDTGSWKRHGSANERKKRGTALPDVYVLGVLVPGEAHTIAPLPPMGGDPLTGMGHGVPKGRDKAHTVAAMGLAPIEMLD